MPRERLPDTRNSIVHKFSIQGKESCKGYIITGLYPDGRPGEVFLVMNKEHESVRGFANAWAIDFSVALQWGAPLSELCRKHAHQRFAPAGFTDNPDIPNAKSIVDYVARWLLLTFSGGAE